MSKFSANILLCTTSDLTKIWLNFNNKVLQKWKFSKNVNNKKRAAKMIFFNEKISQKDLDNFRHRNLTLKVRSLQTAEDKK
jgi:hypothetical protein